MRALNAFIAGFALLAFASGATAQTEIRITGSTAFRTATNQAIRDIFDVSPQMTYGYVGGNNDGANLSIFKGFINGDSVTIKTSFTGAVDGQAAVVSQNTTAVFYLEDGNALRDNTTDALATLSTSGTSNLKNNASAGEVSDVAMLDHDPNTTPFKPPGYPSMEATPVGVIAFKWMVNRGNSISSMSLTLTTGSNVGTVADTASLAPGMTIAGHGKLATSGGNKIGVILDGTTFTIVKNTDGTNQNAVTGTGSDAQTASFSAPSVLSNMTTQLSQALWANGSVSLATVTGNAADDTKVIWALGRDAGSGTRLQAFQESGIGYNSQVVQFEPQASGGVVTAHKRATNPSTLLDDIKVLHPTAGEGGFNSGGTVATFLQSVTSNALDVDGLPHDGTFTGPTGATATGYYVSYVGISDAGTALNGGARELTWNGVPYSITAVREGRYTFWGYQSVGYLSSIASAKKTVADKLAQQIIDVRAPDPKLITMRCKRVGDGGVVLQKY